jgi:predicted DCC family thiol-disulfide oxidoreductase YuxK
MSERVDRDTLYYDGLCGLCQRSTRILRAIDWLGRLRFEDMTKVPEDELPVSMDAALKGIPMRTRDGRTLVGFPALRRAMLRTPLGCLPALLLYLPGISHFGRFIYARVAASRSRAACATGGANPRSERGS